MSRFLNAADGARPGVEWLETMLARLPDEWLTCRDRRIPGDDEAVIAFILLHPEIGVALIDSAPLRQASVAAMSRYLEENGLTGIPVVAVAVAPEQVSLLGERLGAAFAAATSCEPAEPDWHVRAIDLLLSAEDAAMLPLPAVSAAPLIKRSGIGSWRHSTGAKALMLLCAIATVDVFVAGLAMQLRPAAKEPASAAAMLPPASASDRRMAVIASTAEGAPDASDVGGAPPPGADPRATAAQDRAPEARPGPRSQKHVVHRSRARAPVHQRGGNNPREGRFYDENDAWLGPFGEPRPGAPVLRLGGG